MIPKEILEIGLQSARPIGGPTLVLWESQGEPQIVVFPPKSVSPETECDIEVINRLHVKYYRYYPKEQSLVYHGSSFSSIQEKSYIREIICYNLQDKKLCTILQKFKGTMLFPDIIFTFWKFPNRDLLEKLVTFPGYQFSYLPRENDLTEEYCKGYLKYLEEDSGDFLEWEEYQIYLITFIKLFKKTPKVSIKTFRDDLIRIRSIERRRDIFTPGSIVDKKYHETCQKEFPGLLKDNILIEPIPTIKEVYKDQKIRGYKWFSPDRSGHDIVAQVISYPQGKCMAVIHVDGFTRRYEILWKSQGDDLSSIIEEFICRTKK